MIDIPADLLNFLRNEDQRSTNDHTIDEQRKAALEFYNGEPFGDEEEGRSQLVTRDVAEVIDYTVVSIMRTMVSGDKVVEFEADEPEPQQAMAQQLYPDQKEKDQPQPRQPTIGQQVTEAIAYQFMRKQNGYRVLHDSLKAGLLEKTGVVKTFAEPQPPKREVLEVPAGAIDVDERGHTFNGMEVIEGEPLDAGWEPGDVSQMWRIAVRVPQPPAFRDEAVPNGEFRCSPDARDLDSAPYLAHVTPKSLSDLRKMGFDVSDDIWGYIPTESIVEQARDTSSSASAYNNPRTGASRQVWLHEEYARFDLNGDGIDELLCVHRVGDNVLSVEEVDEQPFSEWCPFPMQHRRVGQSQADKTMDIQRTRSVLLRSAMDSIYMSLVPRSTVDEGGMTENTIDDLLTVRTGALIRYKNGMKPEPFIVPAVHGAAFEAMELMTGERESRTGITRHNQGLNPDTLNKTASGMAMLQAAGDQIEEYIARNYAEFLVAPMFAKRYRLMRRLGRPFRMKIDGTVVDVDPSTWPEEIDIGINVGLGSSRKDQRIQYRTMILGLQKEAMAGGLRIVGEEQVYNSVRGLIEDLSLGNADKFVIDPATLGETEEKTDPAALEVQAKAVLEARKLEGEQAERERQDAMKAAELEADLERQRIRDEREMAMKEARAVAESELAIRKQNMDRELAERQQDINAALAARSTAMTPDAATVGAYRRGGEMDA